MHNYALFVSLNFGDSLVICFVLLMIFVLDWYVRIRQPRLLVLALLLFLLALLTKENAMIASLAGLGVVAYLIRGEPSSCKRSLLTFCAVLIGIALVYGLALYGFGKYYVAGSRDYKLGPHMILSMLEYFASLATFSMLQTLPMPVYVATAVLLTLAFLTQSNLVRILLAWTVLFSLPYAPFLYNFQRALYIPSIGFFILVAYAGYGLWQRMPLHRRSSTLIVGGCCLLIGLTANIYLSRLDIEKYDQRSSALHAIARQLQSPGLFIPPHSFVILMNGPDASWIVESVFRLFLDEDTVKVLVLEDGDASRALLRQIDGSRSTRERITAYTGQRPEQVLILAYANGQMVETERIGFADGVN